MLEKSKDLSPLERGELLQNEAGQIISTHQELALEGQTEVCMSIMGSYIITLLCVIYLLMCKSIVLHTKLTGVINIWTEHNRQVSCRSVFYNYTGFSIYLYRYKVFSSSTIYIILLIQFFFIVSNLSK